MRRPSISYILFARAHDRETPVRRRLAALRALLLVALAGVVTAAVLLVRVMSHGTPPPREELEPALAGTILLVASLAAYFWGWRLMAAVLEER